MNMRATRLAILTLSVALAGAAQAAYAAKNPDALKADCAGFAGRAIDAKTITLPTRGGTIKSAEIATLGTANYCKIVGALAPVDPKSYPINFQINLPLAWNGRAVQYGGGGYNGVLITGLDPLRDQPLDLPTPVGRGFMTFGTDSGHQASALPEVMSFALNEEALVNFAYASYKKVHDVALSIGTEFYGKKPERMYYFGGSEGGREGLTMAQRFPADYDGIVSTVPVINWVGLQSVGNYSGILQQNGGWLNGAKVTLLRKAVVAACDADDGLADGIISRYTDCTKKFDAKSLRCADGKDTGDTCLSDPQIAAVEAMHRPFNMGFAVANGMRSYPAYNYGHEDQPGSMQDWVTGPKAAAFPLPAPEQQGRIWYYGSGAVRYFFARDANYNSLKYSPAQFRGRIREISALMDSTNPDLSRFRKYGHKLIMKENAHDFGQSANAGIDYFKSVVSRMGARNVDQFARLYVTPGVNHAGAGVNGIDGKPVPRAVDLLGVLDDWVTNNKAPDTLTQVAQAPAAPFATLSSRPMCRYPGYPHYKGGAAVEAASFICADPRKTPSAGATKISGRN
jgi:feruloyl esterase